VLILSFYFSLTRNVILVRFVTVSSQDASGEGETHKLGLVGKAVVAIHRYI
jgi:hypothetical protein